MISSRKADALSLASLGVLLVALAITIYLTIAHYQTKILVCAVGGDCHTVQTSKYAMFGPIPVALLGLVLIVTLLGLWIARWQHWEDPFTATGLSFILLFVAVVSEGYLTYVEIWVLEAICTWCVLFATTLVILTILELLHLIKMTRESIDDDLAAP
ncbi:MAG TPA: vitamin K epoxide reductase family protein [Thermomicrobiales bacterium]|nr:vitamin K epoxide reductase family protein [Thermomicrobiales bacterium]